VALGICTDSKSSIGVEVGVGLALSRLHCEPVLFNQHFILFGKCVRSCRSCLYILDSIGASSRDPIRVGAERHCKDPMLGVRVRDRVRVRFRVRIFVIEDVCDGGHL